MLKRANVLIGFLAVIIFVFAFSVVIQVQAQTAEQEWSTPINLSQSGAASQPQAVTSTDGRTHILWQDAFNGFVYAPQVGDTLTEPLSVNLPFGREVVLFTGGSTNFAFTPKLVADSNNQLHAFWTDDDDSLFNSRVGSEDFGSLSSWTAQQQLGESALVFDIVVGPNDLLHLAYIRPISSLEFPAGVYYRSSNDGGTVWSNPVLLYASPYFRSLSAQAAHIEIEATGEGEVIIGWDNRPEDRVFIIRSGNSGGTWEEPAEIDRRRSDDLDNAVGPSKISVVDDGDRVHLFWQAGHEALLCAQYHQWSADGGMTWQPIRRVLSEFEGCSQENAYIVVPGGLVVGSVFEAGVYTQFWNGSQWGELKRHGILSGFSNPSTFRLVDFGCRNFIVQNNQVFVIGCDTSNNNDIWQVSTSLENLTQSNVPSESVWTEQALVAAADEGERLESPQLVADADGRLHAFWSQKTALNSTINYIVSEGGGWSEPIDILASPGGSLTEDISAVYHPNGQLMIVWDNGPLGEIYFSRVASSLAGSAVEWFEPELLPALHSTAGSPDIAVDGNGRIYIAYALQLNEERGIYVVKSDDNGESWSNPRLVFDGVVAGWDAVDDPRLAISGDGFIHVLWTEKTIPPADQPVSSAYAASTDGGDSWSEVIDLPFAEVPPVWSSISASGLQTLHRIWQEDFENSSNYWSQISNDSGFTWEQPVRISDRDNPLGQADLVTDGGGTPHLIQLVGSADNGQLPDAVIPMVQHWNLVDGAWVLAQGFDVEPGSLTNIGGITGVVAANGNLVVLYSGLRLNIETGRFQAGYLTSSRSLSVVLPAPTPVPTISVSGTVTVSETTAETPMPTLEPTIQPTPTVFFPQEQGGSGVPVPFLGSIDPLVAIIPLGFIVLLLVLGSVRLVRNRQN